MEILVWIAVILVSSLLPFLISRAFACVLKFFVKEEKFLRILKYVVFAAVLVLELMVMVIYGRRSTRVRIRFRPRNDYEYRTPQRIEQLKKMRDEGSIGDDLYNEALNNMMRE